MNELSEYWGIADSYIPVIEDAMRMRAEGKLSVEALSITNKHIEPEIVKGEGGYIGVIPVRGLLMQRPNWLLGIVGGTSMEGFNSNLDDLLGNSGVKAIILNVDSGGGSTFGIDETAARIDEGRAKKPIYAVANSIMASSAYWLASASDKIFATPGAEIGSIGTLSIHTEQSGTDSMMGMLHTIIKRGKDKALGNPYEPLSPEAVAEIQKHVDRYYEMFVRTVAKGRGVTPHQIEKTYGQGRVFGPPEAKQVGMIDGIATLEQVLDGLRAKKSITRNSPRAEIDIESDNRKLHPGDELELRIDEEVIATAIEPDRQKDDPLYYNNVLTMNDSTYHYVANDEQDEGKSVNESDEASESKDESKGEQGLGIEDAGEKKPDRSTEIPRRRMRLAELR